MKESDKQKLSDTQNEEYFGEGNRTCRDCIFMEIKNLSNGSRATNFRRDCNKKKITTTAVNLSSVVIFC